MILVAYSPLVRGKVTEISELQPIAEKYNCSVHQVSLAWIMHHGAVPIPKATSENHIRNNFKAINVKLADDDIKVIDSIEKQKRMVNPPIVKPKW